jgi:transposase
MPKRIEVLVKESIKELKNLQKQKPSNHNRLQMLILIKEGVIVSKDDLAQALSVSNKSIHVWRTKYNTGGLELLLSDNRRGKQGQITEKIHQKLSTRLHNGKEGFKSFNDIQQWLKESFGIEMEYHAVNKYIKRKFGGRPKVARKSHIDKDDNAVALFKKTT